jgi:hypothetical protein
MDKRRRYMSSSHKTPGVSRGLVQIVVAAKPSN